MEEKKKLYEIVSFSFEAICHGHHKAMLTKSDVGLFFWSIFWSYPSFAPLHLYTETISDIFVFIPYNIFYFICVNIVVLDGIFHLFSLYSTFFMCYDGTMAYTRKKKNIHFFPYLSCCFFLCKCNIEMTS